MEIIKKFAFGKEYEISERVRSLLDKIETIFILFIPQDQTVVRAFFGTIWSTHY